MTNFPSFFYRISKLLSVFFSRAKQEFVISVPKKYDHKFVKKQKNTSKTNRSNCENNMFSHGFGQRHKKLYISAQRFFSQDNDF